MQIADPIPAAASASEASVTSPVEASTTSLDDASVIWAVDMSAMRTSMAPPSPVASGTVASGPPSEMSSPTFTSPCSPASDSTTAPVRHEGMTRVGYDDATSVPLPSSPYALSPQHHRRPAALAHL